MNLKLKKGLLKMYIISVILYNMVQFLLYYVYNLCYNNKYL